MSRGIKCPFFIDCPSALQLGDDAGRLSPGCLGPSCYGISISGLDASYVFQ